MIDELKIGDKSVCPVCGQTFTVTDDTKYIAKGGYVCSWQCFLDHVKAAGPSVKKNLKKMQKALDKSEEL